MCGDRASGLDWLASRMLPGGGFVIVEVENHFDESGTHEGAPVLCVAGYTIDKAKSAQLGADWDAMLGWDALPRRLDFFRMSDCAHGHGQFEGVPVELRIEVEKRAIGIIKEHTAHGLVVTVNQAEFDAIIPQDRALVGSAYSFCSQIILAGVSAWIGDNPQIERAAYFFEAGAAHQAEADWIMRALFRNERAARAHRYAGHGFVPKGGNPGVQAADLLCWHGYTDRKHKAEGRPTRKDFAALLEHRHVVRHIGPDMLRALAERLEDASRALTREAFFFGEDPA
jgi:hypothetical protein